MNKKLTGWKTRFLNMAGRTTLATSTLNSIPNHIMQYHKLPKNINRLIDRTQRNFIWGSTAEKSKLHLVNWHTLTDIKNNGGLGIVSAENKNLTFTRTLHGDFLKTLIPFGPEFSLINIVALIETSSPKLKPINVELIQLSGATFLRDGTFVTKVSVGSLEMVKALILAYPMVTQYSHS